MPIYLIPIIIVGSAFLVFIAFLVKTLMAPKRIDAIAELLRQSKVAQATRAAKAILAKDGRHVDARFLLSQAYLKDKKPELALMELRAINQIGKFGEHATERVYRMQAAELYHRYNHIDDALKEYLLLIKLEPGEATHYFHCGELFEKRENGEKAIGYYIKATQLDGKNPIAHFRLGHLLYRQKRTVEARTELAEAIKLDPENHEAHYYLGRMLKDNGDYTGALASFERAQKSPELKVKALVERGGTYLRMKNYDRAVVDLTRAIRIAPPEKAASPEVLYGRYFLSVCHERSRDMEKAIEQWELIYAKNPRFQDVAEKLSQYQDLRSDDNIKDYITAGGEEFLRICQEALRASNLSVHDSKDVPNGCQLIASENESKWRNTRRLNRMFWFLRVPEMITDSAVRGLLTQMKENNIPRGVIFTSSGFSRSARAFAESRPIDLYGKEQLQKLLSRINQQS